MITTIPLLPLPYKPVRRLLHGFYPLSAFLSRLFPNLEWDLDEAGSTIPAKDYLSGAILAFCVYALAIGSILGLYLFRNDLLGNTQLRIVVVGFTLLFSLAIFSYILLIPRWLASKRRAGIERQMLHVSRHLMIQTSAGVPLFDAMVSISEDYGDDRLNYGPISREFSLIVREVRAGKDLGDALDESAARNNSSYYQRLVWQLANAHRSGTQMGTVLAQVVEFLSSEQRVAIRNYGSQLGTLSMLYLFMCVIAPTMGMIFLAILSSLSDLPLGEVAFGAMLVFLIVFQIMFIGLIKSRRPVVDL